LDRRRRRAAVLAALLLPAAAAALAAEAPLRALRWLAPGADPARALATAPAECLRPPSDSETALAVEVGRAAFRSPLLLGGPAARAGVACETCHQGGRDNRDFLFPGLSGAPGTADVTSSLFSSHRGDGIDDPRPIPDLSGPKAKLKVAQDPAADALTPFIRGLVVEEFDGAEPPPAVLAGLAAYVRSLDPAACPAPARQPLTSGLYAEDARRAVRAARALAGRGDAPAALSMVAAARARLGLIDERFARGRFAAERRRLAKADRGLGGAAQALREARSDAPARLDRWLAATVRLGTDLSRREDASLFAPAVLARAAARPLPGKAP
jgi:hypothetical protein